MLSGETRVADLIKEIKRGGLILPEFQRGYVWSRDQVRSYLNSLYRGYPSGSFLIWRTPTPPKVRGDSLTDDSTSYRLILDGQQRLTSLFALLEGEPPPFYEGEKLFFDIHFNVVTEEFAYYKAGVMKNNPDWIAVTAFFKKGLAGFLEEVSSLDDDARRFYFGNMTKLTALDRIKDYNYYQKDLTELDMDRVVEVFNLVNSSGTRLSKSDLALAHICSMWPEARERFRQAQLEYGHERFGFDLNFFTRCTSIVATGSALYDPLYKTPIDKVRDAWPRVRKALDYLLNVLRGEAYIDTSSSLPSEMVLVPMVSYLAINGKPHFDSDAEKRNFLHWMYAAMMWARYSGSTDTKLQADIEALKSDDPPARLRENLIADRGRIKVEAKDLEGAGISNPMYPMTYIVARSRGAVDWFQGTPLYQKAIGKSFGLENHHIFPSALLYKSGYESTNSSHKRMVNEIANIAYLTQQANLGISDRRPEDYLPTVVAKYPDALRQQSVPESTALWSVDRFGEFLAERRRRLAEAINTYMDSLLQPANRAGMTISDFVARGEGPRLEFKSSFRWDYRQQAVNPALEKVIAKTIAGLMNYEGGTLVVGVADNGTILGLDSDMASFHTKPDRDGLQLYLTNLLAKYIGTGTASLVDVSLATVDDHTVAVLSADRARQPVFVQDQGQPEFYVRSGSQTRPLDIRDATDYIASHWGTAA